MSDRHQPDPSPDRYQPDLDSKSGDGRTRNFGKVDDQDRKFRKGEDQISDGRNRWEKAVILFTLLKAKIAATPILKHFHSDRTPVIVVYASKWALLQEYDGTYCPVTFTSWTLIKGKSTGLRGIERSEEKKHLLA